MSFMVLFSFSHVLEDLWHVEKWVRFVKIVLENSYFYKMFKLIFLLVKKAMIKFLKIGNINFIIIYFGKIYKKLYKNFLKLSVSFRL